MEWIDIKKKPIPIDGKPVLVYLEKKILKSRIHVATSGLSANKKPITYVGGHFDFDMPEILCWMDMSFLPEPPEVKNESK